MDLEFHVFPLVGLVPTSITPFCICVASSLPPPPQFQLSLEGLDGNGGIFPEESHARVKG